MDKGINSNLKVAKVVIEDGNGNELAKINLTSDSHIINKEIEESIMSILWNRQSIDWKINKLLNDNILYKDKRVQKSIWNSMDYEDKVERVFELEIDGFENSTNFVKQEVIAEYMDNDRFVGLLDQDMNEYFNNLVHQYRLVELTNEVQQFIMDDDTYEYRDRTESEIQSYNEILSHLQNGKYEGLIKYFETEIIENYSGHTFEEKKQLEWIIKELYQLDGQDAEKRIEELIIENEEIREQIEKEKLEKNVQVKNREEGVER